jgi:hypothetical protein
MVKVKAKAKAKKVNKWLGDWPTNCDICKCDLHDQASSVDANENLNGYFVLGLAKTGNKMLMCPSCHIIHGADKGQRFSPINLQEIEG